MIFVLLCWLLKEKKEITIALSIEIKEESVIDTVMTE